MGEYDLELTRRDDESSFGYMLDWESESPMRVSSEPPQLPVSTSTGVAESGGAYSGRDAAPPYPIEVNNWQDGAGQASYDMKNASPDAFYASRNIDVSDEGHFELGPRSFSYSYEGIMGNRSLYALGTFWGGFTPSGSDPQNSVRYMVRYPVIAGTTAGTYLPTTTDLYLTPASLTGLTDLTGAVPAATITPWDYLYCPVHNEIVYVQLTGAGMCSVLRGQCGTTAAAHAAGERWYGIGWRSVTFTGPDPTAPVTALCSDGGKVYAAFYSGSGASGDIWSGTASTSWTKFGDIQQVVAMAYCAGYLYCAQDNVGGVSQVTAVESNGTTTHVLTGAGGIAPNVTTAGLCTIGNYVYWAVTDGHSKSWVYRVQYSATGSVFELAAELPDGFVATSIVSALQQLYVGGYVDTLVTDADNAGDQRYQGYLYAVIESEITVACKWGDPDEDYRIKALVAGGPNIYMLTPNDVRAYSLEHGGWWHVADVTTSSATQSSERVSWRTSGFEYLPKVTALAPSAASSVYTDAATWESGTTGFVDSSLVVRDYSSTPGLVIGLTAAGFGTAVSAQKYYRWTLDGLPAGTTGTMEAEVSEVSSQGGAMCMAGSTKEARVYFQGGTAGGVPVYKVGLRYSEDGTTYAGTRWSSEVANIPAADVSTVRLTMDAVSGAKLYLNGSLIASAAYNELVTVTGTDATKVWFACGWPGDAQTNTNAESMRWGLIRFTSAGAYSPDYVPTIYAVDTDSVSFGEGRLLVPAPATCATYIDPKENYGSGWLRTSESGLHMGTVNKYFTAVDVSHTALKSGQTLTIMPYVDGVLAGTTTVTGPSAGSGTTTSTAPISVFGKRLSTSVTLADTDNDRRSSDRLRVSSITGRFFPENSARLHTFVLNCRRGVQTRAGNPWSRDPDAAIRHAFSIADSGEVVDVKCLWGEFAGRIEELDLSGYPADRTRYDAMSGVMRMKVRSIE